MSEIKKPERRSPLSQGKTKHASGSFRGASVAPEIGVPLTGWLSVRGVSQRLEIKGLKFFRFSDHSLLP